MEHKTLLGLLKITKEMGDIYNHLLTFLDAKVNGDQEFDIFKNFLRTPKVLNTAYKMSEFLHILSMISMNHHREVHFFNRIRAIFIEISSKINQFFPNIEIFKIFQNNKRILLILIEEKILSLDSHIARRLCRIDLSQLSFENVLIARFFYLEIEPYFNETMKQIIQMEIQDEKQFRKYRKNGENHNEICETIRRDCVADFAGYIRRNKVALDSKIPSSMFETNLFLANKEKDLGMPTLMQYAAFFGAVTIVRYLIDNKIELTPDLWIYAVHGRNIDIFRILQDHHINPPDDSYDNCKIEAIRCGHQDMLNYISNQFLFDSHDVNNKIYLRNAIEFYNFEYISSKTSEIPDMANDIYAKICEYDYLSIAEKFLELPSLKINHRIILNQLFHGILSFCSL